MGRFKLFNKKGELVRISPNLWVDDSKELTLDFLYGCASWWNYKEDAYGPGESGWNQDRYIGAGLSMFNNKSFERASGIRGIPSGEEYNYPVEDTYLVSVEDSFLSEETGRRVKLAITRRDQTVEMQGTFEVPIDISAGVNIREFGVFLKNSGPSEDPSQDDYSKNRAMICRSTLFGTGYYNEVGPCTENASGAKLCYYDDPYLVTDDINFMWEAGEL